MDWFRSHHGAPTDPKWQVIARRSGVPAGNVAAVFWALMDFASQHVDRGSVVGFDTEIVSAVYGYPEEQVQAIVAALAAKGMIVDGRLANWDRRQPKREDGSAERAKSWRESQRTQPNATERLDTDKNRTEKSSPLEPPLVLDLEIRDYAKRHAPNVTLETELEKYLNWKASKGKRHKRPRRAFMNWLIRAQEYAAEKTEKSNGSKPYTASESLYAGAAIALQRHAEREREGDHGPDFSVAEPLPNGEGQPANPRLADGRLA